MTSGARRPLIRLWLHKNQRTIREWLLLLAAVIAGFVGWQQIADERNAHQVVEQEAQGAEHRAQAEEIAVWPGRGGWVILSNHSHQPVYQAVVSRVAVEGAGPHTGRDISQKYEPRERKPVLVIPPGKTDVRFPFPFGGMGLVPGYEIAFQDQAGNSWVRYANGDLEEIHRRPVGYYRLERPVIWH
jgi:hypothetical protein